MAGRLGARGGCLALGLVPLLVLAAPVITWRRRVAHRRDVIAARVRGALTAGESHRCPQLWLTLPAGHYLAAAVNPNLPFVVAEAALLGLLADGRARHALLTEVDAGSVSSRIALALYTPRSEVRKFFTLARSVLEELSDLRAAR